MYDVLKTRPASRDEVKLRVSKTLVYYYLQSTVNSHKKKKKKTKTKTKKNKKKKKKKRNKTKKNPKNNVKLAIYSEILKWQFTVNQKKKKKKTHYENTAFQTYWKFHHQKLKVFR